MQVHWLGKLRGLGIGVLLCALLWPWARSEAAPNGREYRLQVGDVVEITVLGAPELNQRAPVQIDGAIALSAIGRIAVVGLTAQELQTRLSLDLAQIPLRQRLPDGRDQAFYVRPTDVAARVAEFRPVFVNGDVLAPGQFPFRPSMTVRQLLILAGGVSLTRKGELPVRYDPIDLDRDYKALSVDIARTQVQLWGLEAEKAGLTELKQLPLDDLPVAEAVVSGFVQTQNELLALSRKDVQQEREFIQDSIKRTEHQVAFLAQQEEAEQKAVQAEREERQLVDQLVQRGNASRSRSLDTRRAVMQTTSQRMQTHTMLMQNRLQLDDLKSKLARLENTRKIAILRQISEGSARLEDFRLKLASVADKIRLSKSTRSLMDRDASRLASFVIVRSGPNGREHLPARSDTEIEPGDVVEVTFQGNNIFSLKSN